MTLAAANFSPMSQDVLDAFVLEAGAYTAPLENTLAMSE